MAEGYAKLFSGITKSTLWTYDAEIRIVWIHMMAEADENGVWVGTAPGLAQAAGIALPKVREALATFLAPDPDSGSKEFDGRRIEAVDRGWRLLNYAKYRALRSREQKLESDRIRMAEKRASETPMIPNMSHSVAGSREESLGVANVAQAEAEAEAEKREEDPPVAETAPATLFPLPHLTAEPPREPEFTREFLGIWAYTGRRGSKKKAFKAWKKRRPSLAAIMPGWDAYQQTDSARSGCVYHLSTWLNDDGWLQEWTPGQRRLEPRKTSPPTVPADVAAERQRLG